MKTKRILLILANLLVMTMMVSGCGTANKATSSNTGESKKVSATVKSIKPYAKKLAAVKDDAKRIGDETDITVKVEALKKFEADYQQYQDKNKSYQQVISEYQNAIKQIKQSIQTSNQSSLKQASVTSGSAETQSTISKKNKQLKVLKASLVAQRDVVYTTSAFQLINRNIDNQLVKNNAQLTDSILSTDQSQKYVEAYEHFTKQGNSKGPERGNSPTTKDFLSAIGLTEQEFYSIWGGIYDYYGNAVEKGWITQTQADQATKAADKKLDAGDYAKHAIDRHKMNFYRIRMGDYSSLVGSWKEVAEGTNFHKGKGFEWLKQTSNAKLSVSNTRMSDGQFTLSGSEAESKITDNGQSGMVTFEEKDSLQLNAAVGVMNWMITFYPKNATIKDAPAGIDSSKEHIEVWTSNNSFTEVFER